MTTEPFILTPGEIRDLLETPDPIPGALLAERNAGMRKAVEMATEIFSELSETARLHYDFWTNLLPGRISEHRFEYTTKVTDTYHWELTINASGLFYKDLSGEFNFRPGSVSEQLFSHFWFYGPLMPIPDLTVRQQLVAIIRNAFEIADSPGVHQHFDLFEYPKPLVSPLYWEFGNYKDKEFIAVRNHGIETGASNWRDGPVYQNFISFENFLNLPPREGSIITPEIRSVIEQHLAQKPAETETKLH